MVAWRFGRPKSDHNFPDVTSVKEAEFLAPPVRIVSCDEEKEDRLVVEQRTAQESDAVAMSRFAEANPHLVAAEREFYTKRDAERKKEDKAGPSGVIKIESDNNDDCVEFDTEDARSWRLGTVPTPRMMTSSVSIVVSLP